MFLAASERARATFILGIIRDRYAPGSLLMGTWWVWLGGLGGSGSVILVVQVPSDVNRLRYLYATDEKRDVAGRARPHDLLLVPEDVMTGMRSSDARGAQRDHALRVGSTSNRIKNLGHPVDLEVAGRHALSARARPHRLRAVSLGLWAVLREEPCRC